MCFFVLALGLLGWYSRGIAEVVRGLVDASSEVVGLPRRSLYDVVLREDWAWVKRGMEDPGLVYRVSYRTVGFCGLLDTLGTAVALREGYLVGSEVRVVTGGEEERSFDVDSVCRELVERAMRILFETTGEAVSGARAESHFRAAFAPAKGLSAL